MPGLFENYRVALLDSSFFVSKFSESVQIGLEDVNVYVADTFNAEIEQYKAVLSSSKSAAYEANIIFLNHTKQLKTLNLESFGDKGKSIHNDTWGVLTLLVGMNAKFVLITADQLLIQRVVLHNLNVDIYDLNKNTFIYHNEFSSYRGRFEFNVNASWAASTSRDDHVTEKSTLYRRNGSPVVLGKEIKSGLEANLFLVDGNPNLIVKVFKKDKLSANKYKNIVKIQNINRTLDIPWALFPIEVVFYDANCTIPAGFTESYARTKGDLDENPLYLGDIDLPDDYLNTHISASLELCLKVVRQVHYLNSYGFLVSDFNMGNFALSQANSNCIQMWDTDSFGYETFFSGYCAGSKTSREYDITKKDGAIDFCSEALYLFAFSVLSLGDAPISEFSGKFKFDNPNYGALYRKELFPDNLWRLFEEVFRGEKEPSVEVLLQQLHVALQKCRNYPASDKTYKELLGEVIEESESSGSTSGGYSGGYNGGSSGGASSGTSGGTSGGTTSGSTDEGMPGWLKAILIAAAVGFVLFLMANS